MSKREPYCFNRCFDFNRKEFEWPLIIKDLSITGTVISFRWQWFACNFLKKSFSIEKVCFLSSIFLESLFSYFHDFWNCVFGSWIFNQMLFWVLIHWQNDVSLFSLYWKGNLFFVANFWKLFSTYDWNQFFNFVFANN